MFPTVDSSAAALAAAFLFLTCLPQQRWKKVMYKQNGVILLLLLC